MLFRNFTYVDEHFQTRTGNIVVEGNKIVSITDTPPAGYQGEVMDGAHKMMLPGLYNIHCHVPMVLLRGYGEGLDLHRWLHEKMFPFEAKMKPEAMYWGAMLGIAEMLKSGCASFTDMYMNTMSIVEAVEESGIKINICHGATCFDDNLSYMQVEGGPATEALVKHMRSASHDRIVADVGLHAEYTSTPRLVQEVGAYAKAEGLRVHVHISETRKEHDECKQRRNGRTPARYLYDMGLFDVPTTAAHCVFAEDEDIDIFREKGVTVAHCPSSNLKLGSGIARIWKMHNEGVNVGVATDGAASNNNLNCLEELNLAGILQRGALQDPMAMDMPTMMAMGAQNGAQSQGRMDCGCIRVGNRADLVVYDLDKPHLTPVFDPLSNVLFSGQAEDICLHMIDGKVVYKDGALLTMDIEKVMFESRRIQKEILAQL